MAAEESAADMERRCGRTVEKNKYETNAPETRTWWAQLFKILEFDAQIPVDKRMEILQEVLPSRILDRVLEILDVENKKYTDPLVLAKDEVGDALKKDKDGSDASMVPDTEASIVDEEEMAKHEEEVVSRASSSVEQFGARPPKKPNPYLNFFKRRLGREAVWRNLPPLTMEEMNLGQRSAYITETIARNFVDWIKTLGGDEESYLTVQGVVEMFEIGFPVNSTTSLRVELKGMPSVPKQVAASAMMPELATRSRLHQEIKRDKRASRKIPHIVAFGRRLPAHMQLKPPNKEAFNNWLHCVIPERLDTMAEVWQGITHLKSTKAFCEYLYYQRPDVEPPQYLTNVGLMDMDVMAKRKNSADQDDNFGNILHLTNVM